ncbi:hypothetical protein PGH12_08035 [Chryseobacterium wangxinyae]|uniref:hypothetical protein n=1 Tax=Chryseobacterium sp. CY350 TaxID=2997336 RepID=UPI00226F9869|nr:hypothetical protein [Chryseobacterium sp. CY350]MCY0977093.1 hypothetical protein [Chryseobacterium sp. CY350]WBZ97090.1 hypothetical protein PGH12_08035 [Chryseobacterium sp. CY350]
MKKISFLFILVSIICLGQKSDIDSKITMTNGKIIETKIPFRVNMFSRDLINELSVTDKYVVVFQNGEKIKYLSSAIQRLEFTDLKNRNRTFVHAPDFQDVLVELLHDGKIKWYRSYFANGYDGSVQLSDFLVKNGTIQKLGLFVNNRKRLKALMSDKPELEPLIEKINYDKLSDQDLLNILKRYDE